MTFYYKTDDDSIVRSDVEINEARFTSISEADYLSEKNRLDQKKENALAAFKAAGEAAKSKKLVILAKLGLTEEEAQELLSV